MESATAIVPRNEEEKALLQQIQAELGSERLPPIPQIKLCNVKSEVMGVSVGEYYIDEVEYDQAKGERTKKITTLGQNPKVIVIKKRYSYAYYDKENDRLIAWTNELDLDPVQRVHIAFNDGSEAKVIATMPKQEFKNLKATAKAKKGQLQSMTREETICANFKFRNILYVWHPETKKGYKMFVSNASGTGVKDGEAKHGSFDDIQPKSFIEFQNRMTVELPKALFKNECILGSRAKKDTKGDTEYYLMTFESGEALSQEEFSKMMNTWKALNNELDRRFESEFLAMVNDSPVEVLPRKEEAVSVEDLPF